MLLMMMMSLDDSQRQSRSPDSDVAERSETRNRATQDNESSEDSVFETKNGISLPLKLKKKKRKI